eukprot:GDKJ01015444.1.p1 GENE.GDKJ01015444.1~~GDKJ01015444.1.p1  ORF type:complete len:581 (-),score=80.46 GDKJ01015444.1:65-1768(-)
MYIIRILVLVFLFSIFNCEIPDDTVFVPHLGMYCASGTKQLRCTYWGANKTLNTKVLSLGGTHVSCVTQAQVLRSCFHGVYKDPKNCCFLSKNVDQCTCSGGEGISYPGIKDEKMRVLISPVIFENECLSPIYPSNFQKKSPIPLKFQKCTIQQSDHLWRVVALNKMHTEDARFQKENYFSIRNSPASVDRHGLKRGDHFGLSGYTDENTCLTYNPLRKSLFLSICHSSLGTVSSADDLSIALSSSNVKNSLWEIQESPASGFYFLKSVGSGGDCLTVHYEELLAEDQRNTEIQDDYAVARDPNGILLGLRSLDKPFNLTSIHDYSGNDASETLSSTGKITGLFDFKPCDPAGKLNQIFNILSIPVEGTVGVGFIPKLETPLKSRMNNPLLGSAATAPKIRVGKADYLWKSGSDKGLKAALDISSKRGPRDLAMSPKAFPRGMDDVEWDEEGSLHSSKDVSWSKSKVVGALSQVVGTLEQTRKQSFFQYFLLLIVIGAFASLIALFADNLWEFFHKFSLKNHKRRNSWTKIPELVEIRNAPKLTGSNLDYINNQKIQAETIGRKRLS